MILNFNYLSQIRIYVPTPILAYRNDRQEQCTKDHEVYYIRSPILLLIATAKCLIVIVCSIKIVDTYYVTGNIMAEWLKLRFKYLALTPDVIHLLETLR